VWDIISMDFIEGLPQSGRYNCILVVIDSFSKFGHFIPLRHPFTALTMAEAFLDTYYRLHGLPESIISDRDRVFTSTFWRELFCLTDTQLRMSTAYHPQTDGQTERVNQSIECFLRCFIHAHPTRWAKWLPLCEFWYNTNWHSSLGKSPFEVVYGRQPRYFGISPVDTVTSSDLQQWLDNQALRNQSV
jgi:transposase InsO family protein